MGNIGVFLKVMGLLRRMAKDLGTKLDWTRQGHTQCFSGLPFSNKQYPEYPLPAQSLLGG